MFRVMQRTAKQSEKSLKSHDLSDFSLGLFFYSPSRRSAAALEAIFLCAGCASIVECSFLPHIT